MIKEFKTVNLKIKQVPGRLNKKQTRQRFLFVQLFLSRFNALDPFSTINFIYENRKVKWLDLRGIFSEEFSAEARYMVHFILK